MNKARLKRLHTDDSVCMTFWKRQNYRDRKQISGCERQRVGELTAKRQLAEILGFGGLPYHNCCSGYMLYPASKGSKRQFLFFFFFFFFWEIIDIHHCLHWRHIAWWFDLHVLWSDYYLAFTISCRYKKKENRKKNLLVMRTLRTYSLNNFPI